MEDILASIRRIINEDAPPPPPLARPAAPAPAPTPPAEEEVLDLIEPEAAPPAPAPASAAPAVGRGTTIEDLVREMLKPLLRQWLDENLPDLVRQQVASEISRIARRD